jgi:hypothetical protein
MDSRETNRDAEIHRYREAATRALDQLQWTVGYLRQIRKLELARALERNRKRILKSIS